jgi:hypothetical protein
MQSRRLAVLTTLVALLAHAVLADEFNPVRHEPSTQDATASLDLIVSYAANAGGGFQISECRRPFHGLGRDRIGIQLKHRISKPCWRAVELAVPAAS